MKVLTMYPVVSWTAQAGTNAVLGGFISLDSLSSELISKWNQDSLLTQKLFGTGYYSV